MSYFDDNEARITGLPRRRRRAYVEQADTTCKRCGAQGCWWWQMPAPDGGAEVPVMFGPDGKRHVCPPAGADEFEVLA